MTKLEDLEPVYKLMDAQRDESYISWYGTQDNIIDYLKEMAETDPDFQFEGTDSWVKGLEDLGLTYKQIN